MIEVLKPGAMTLVQDLGRVGHQRFGVPVSGAMDLRSHRLGNALVGNPDSAATLEIVLTGPTLRFAADTLLALTGADMAAVVTGPGGAEPLPPGRPVWIRAGARVECGVCRQGLRAYVAVHGGIGVPSVLGSRSTWTRGRIGGVDGRALVRGDRLPAGEAGAVVPRAPAAAHWRRSACAVLVVPAVPLVVAPPDPGAVVVVRLIAGPEWEAFTPAARATLGSAVYRVGLQSDRMGYRLEGPALERVRPIEMISEAIVFGTVQVPPDGLPIVLMADRQTIGGYPKIGVVAAADLPVLAQLAPRQGIRFSRIALEDAERILLAREREYSHVRDVVAEALT